MNCSSKTSHSTSSSSSYSYHHSSSASFTSSSSSSSCSRGRATGPCSNSSRSCNAAAAGVPATGGNSTFPTMIFSHCRPYRTLPAGRMPALGRHPALRPQHGPSAHPRQTSRSIEPLRSFGKPQEEKPMDVTQRMQ